MEKTQELLMTVSRVALTNDGSVQHVQSGEQGGGSVPLIVMGLALWRSGNPGRNGRRLGAIQGLNLALLVHAENEGFIGRVQV